MSTRGTIDLKTVRKKLRKLGFEKKRDGRKHEIWDDGNGHVVCISRAVQDVGPKLFKSICSQAGVEEQEFLDA